MSLTAKEFCPGDHVGLAEQALEHDIVAEGADVADAVVDARAALDPVEAGELVAAEEDRIVEHQALRVVVRQFAGIRLVRTGDDLHHRLDHVR